MGEKISQIIAFVVANYQAILAAITAILTGVIGICMLIPGNQPESFLQKVVDFIAKFSKK